MGKWATYAKRGSAEAFGSMLAPVAADWTFTSPSSGQFSFNRITAIPAPATQWGMRIRQATFGWGLLPATVVNPRTGAATSGTTQEGQIAWFDANGIQLSPYSDVKSVVIV